MRGREKAGSWEEIEREKTWVTWGKNLGKQEVSREQWIIL